MKKNNSKIKNFKKYKPFLIGFTTTLVVISGGTFIIGRSIKISPDKKIEILNEDENVFIEEDLVESNEAFEEETLDNVIVDEGFKIDHFIETEIKLQLESLYGKSADPLDYIFPPEYGMHIIEELSEEKARVINVTMGGTYILETQGKNAGLISVMDINGNKNYDLTEYIKNLGNNNFSVEQSTEINHRDPYISLGEDNFYTPIREVDGTVCDVINLETNEILCEKEYKNKDGFILEIYTYYDEELDMQLAATDLYTLMLLKEHKLAYRYSEEVASKNKVTHNNNEIRLRI